MPAKKAPPARPLEQTYEKALERLDKAHVDLLRRLTAARPALQAFKIGTPLGDLGRAMAELETAEAICDSCRPDHAGRTAR